MPAIFDSFRAVGHESSWWLANFWGQLTNSFFSGVAVCLLMLAIGRMRISPGMAVDLRDPFCAIIRKFGVADNSRSVIAGEVTFAMPYAIFIFAQ